MMDTNENLLNNELQVDSTATVYLKEAAMWAKFIGIVGIILSILFLIIAIFAGSFLGNVMRTNSYPSSELKGVMGGLVTVLYVILAGITFLVSLLMFRFGTRTKAALLTNDQGTLNAGLNSLKNLFRVYGIFTIIYLGLIFLATIGGILSAVFGSR